MVLLDKVCKIMLIVWDMGEFRFFFCCVCEFLQSKCVCMGAISEICFRTLPKAGLGITLVNKYGIKE